MKRHRKPRKQQIGIGVDPETKERLEKLAAAGGGDFTGTSLRRRSLSEACRVLLEYALDRFPTWERERLNAVSKGGFLR